MTQKIKTDLLYGFVVLAILAFMYLLGSQTPKTYGSTIMGNDYNATSTAAVADFGGMVSTGANGTIIKSLSGAFGSVVITGANTGVLNFYDATTTNILNRTNNTSTSSILITSFPANTAAGTYTFDVEFSTALLIDLDSGAMPTTTIMFR